MAELLPLLRSISPDPGPARRVTLDLGALHLDPTAGQLRLRGRIVGLALRKCGKRTARSSIMDTEHDLPSTVHDHRDRARARSRCPLTPGGVNQLASGATDVQSSLTGTTHRH
jgi:hypothetical protein